MNSNQQQTGRWSMVGAIATAFAASICCVGPLVLLVLGVGGAWASRLAALEPYRPVFMLLAVGFLASAFYRAYRPSTGSGACATDGTCAVSRAGRIGRAALWLITPIVLALLAFPYIAPYLFAQHGVAGQSQSGLQHVKLSVQNMTCASCSVTVRKSLMDLNGVKEARVVVDPPQAVVSYDPSKVTPQMLAQATANAGYPSSVIKEQSMSSDCCQVGADGAGKSGATTQPMKFDLSHEVLFKVPQLGCPLVKGVGCGHLLAPRMSQINQIEGVSGTFSNWTGSLLRVEILPTADRETVAARVRTFLAADGQKPARVEGQELTALLSGVEWRDLSRITELSSYEFKTVAKRRIDAFADSEKLDSSKRQQLLSIVDSLWDKSSAGLDNPKADAAAYADYWQHRRDGFVTAYVEQAREVLTPEQVGRLIRDYGPHTN